MPRLLTRLGPPLDLPFEANTDSMQARGLVGWWPMIGANGVSIPGYVGARVLMATAGSPPIVADPVVGRMLSLDGTTQFAAAAAGAIPVFQQTTPFSVACWFSTTDTDAGLVGNMNVGTTAGWFMDVNAGSVRMVLANAAVTAGRAVRTTSTSLNGGALTHVVATYDGSSSSAGILIYVNGYSVALTGLLNTTPGTLVDNACAVGIRPGLMVGRITDPRIYNRVLNTAEVWQQFAPQTRWELYRTIKWRTIVRGTPTPVVATPGTIALTNSLLAPKPLVRPQPSVVALTSAMLAQKPLVRPKPSAVTLTTALPASTPRIRPLPSSVALSTTGLAPVIPRVIRPGLVSLTLTAQAAIPALRAPQSAVSLLLSEPAPHARLTGLPGAVPLATTLADVRARFILRNVGLIGLTTAEPTPTPQLRPLPALVALSASALLARAQIHPLSSVVALALSLLAPSIQTGSGTTVSPSTVALALSILATMPRLRTNPTLVPLTATTLAPQALVKPKPSSVALALTQPSPVLRLITYPLLVPLVASVLSPRSLLRPRPSLVTLLLTVPLATPDIGSPPVVALPGVIGVVLAAPAPQTQRGIHPGVVTLFLVIPDPTGNGTSAVPVYIGPLHSLGSGQPTGANAGGGPTGANPGGTRTGATYP